MAHELPELPYENNALEPHIDARTMGIHYTKHHQAYVDNLNQALADYEDLQGLSTIKLLADLTAVPEEIRTAIRNNGGGHFNHSMFWPSMSPKGGGEPQGSLGKEIDESFGSFEDFQEVFTKSAMTRFGSGWAWLCVGDDGTLIVTSTANQDNPISEGLVPLLGLDVWEHAYYLNYQNRRAAYVEAWWNVVNWDYVSANYTAVQIGKGIDTVGDWVDSTWGKLEEGWRKLTGS
jgi:Fe-Mn family superoxide dismutase